MSYQAVNWAKDQDDLLLSEKAVLKALAERADENNRCWPGKKRISKDSGASMSSVKRAIKVLCAKNYIDYEERRLEREDRNLTNIYTLKIGNQSVKSSPVNEVEPNSIQEEPTLEADDFCSNPGEPREVHDEPRGGHSDPLKSIEYSEKDIIIKEHCSKNNLRSNFNQKNPNKQTICQQPKKTIQAVNAKVLEQIRQVRGEEFTNANALLIRSKLTANEDYCRKRGFPPDFWMAYQYVETGINNYLKTQYRTAKITAARDEKAAATANHLQSIAKSIQKKTSDIIWKSRTTLEALTDTTWADAINFDNEFECIS
ncbi:helix-turn-helix domain-containing protein [Endozoicomonas sp. SM1973]|uniref:Helix-turn-helix domain-containing protein n=1 Tax=Spartinivicinus marinus TaxID=2994442 RepID=A0A853IE64_9GAMM|nr:helix-turn-helix domain-containing protein [Spartinivicinus marinus]MCX4030154.1 helix-turn-helix domain-containing protein [Spartinivicinus marinus]NYZ67797.1 helix-turn-helix domain-containing protein [Spartinivicinus marinus]